MSEKSRIFWRKDGPGSDPANEKTFISTPVASVTVEPPPTLAIRDVFIRHYSKIREWCTSEKRRGVTLVALTEDSVEGAAFVAAKPEAIATAVLGRHTRADLRLGGDASVSLRHLALLVYPMRPVGQRPRYRLLDLRTAEGFTDERGKHLRAIEADGPAFVRCGCYTLLFFPIEETDASWPEEAESGWNYIPERIHIDEVVAEARPADWEESSDQAWEVVGLPRVKEDPTLVHSVAGPEIAVERLLEEGDHVLGELRIGSPRGLATVVVGRRVAQSGILLGRSRRCDAGRVLSDRSISRVHLLVIEIAEKLYVVDTASSNGTFFQGTRARAVGLETESHLSLGDFATLDWTPSSSDP